MADTPQDEASPPRKPKRPPKHKSTPKRTARALALRDKEVIDRTKREKFSDLPRWVRLALVETETQDITYQVAAERHGFSKSSLEKYASSPAGKAWRAQVAEVMEDPMRLSEITLRANAANVTLEYLMAFQQAIDAGDYREAGVMARDVLDRLGMTKTPKTGQGAGARPQIVINLGAGISLEAPTVKTSYEETVEEAEWVEDDNA